MELKTKVLQVKELEESNIRILQENQMLSEKISGLQVQLQNVEASSNIKNVSFSPHCTTHTQHITLSL